MIRHGLDRTFWDKVELSAGCWLWTAATNSKGYGCFGIDGRRYLAHRLAYEDAVGPIPDGLTIDHLCRVKTCVRPSHLEPVTLRENVRRAKSLITHCPQGHPYEGDNLVMRRNKRTGWVMRNCRECLNTARRVKARDAEAVAS